MAGPWLARDGRRLSSSSFAGRTLLPHGDAAVSESMGTILLTAITIVLASGFALVVFSQFAGQSDTPAPAASFNLDARSGLPYVNVTLSEGTSFLVDQAEYQLSITGATVGTPYIVNPLALQRFSPGDVMRFDIMSGSIGAGSNMTFFAIDKESGEVIGFASASVPLPSALPLYMSNVPSATSVTFSPNSVPADATTATTITANVGSTYGLALVTTVTADLTSIGGVADHPLNDAGLDGDAVAGDGIYTSQFTVGTGALGTGVPSMVTSVPVNVEDVFGHASSAGTGSLTVTALATFDLADIVSLIQNSSSVTNILGVGGISRNVPNSSALYNLTITNFTWRDISELDNDVILFRIADLYDTTKTWVVAAYFSSCAASDPSGPLGGVIEVTWSRDGVAGYASWRPASGCWNVDYDAILNVADLNRSINASGASPLWVGTTVPTGSNPGIWSYANASIGTINQGIVPYFGDTQPTANPHGSVDDLGLGTAAISWSRGAAPVPSFTWTRSNLQINVDGSSSVATAGGTLTYLWDWGDGTTAGTGVTASHTYATAGTYTVTLTVTTTAGVSASTSTSVTPNRAPTAMAAVTVTGIGAVSASSSGSSDPDGQTLTYTWMWGDGTKSTTTATTSAKAYATPGLYTITLYANDTLDGSATATAIVGQSPTASFTYSALGLTVSTNGSASTSPSGPLSYSWDWGDGNTTSGATSSHTYDLNGTNTVTLTVTTNFGITASTNSSILHEGNNWLVCPPVITTGGSITSCANLRSSTDSGASATMSETSVSGTRSLLMVFNMTASAEPGKTHTLQARAGQSAGSSEALALQVYDPTTGIWTTHATWAGVATVSSPMTLTDNQWNNGNPTFRFTDANCITGTCIGSDTNTATWLVDWIRVVSS